MGGYNKFVQRIGRSIGKTVDMLEIFDKINGVPHQSGYHSGQSSKGDIEKMLKQLLENSKVITGRCHRNFKNFCSNIVASVDPADLKQWMTEQFNKLVIYE